jgi:1-acyl-sn-glycerol-3-phosphate acyltransferase
LTSIRVDFDFDDIRPYQDEEVDGVLSELVEDPEFLGAVATLRLPKLFRLSKTLTRSLVRRKLKQKLNQYHSVSQLQHTVEKYLGRCLKDTAATVNCDGLENLDPAKNYLFLCNHRDIVLDAAICNVFLHRAGCDTFRIAIGDNLLKKPYSSNLMRLNKSFIVKRGIENLREKLKELIKLSAYIRLSINKDKQSVWIAHREGRSKDGLDKTDTALLKMLNLSGDKELSFAENSHQLHIVPTAISYEWDPCDLNKAQELAALAKHGNYEKSELEDINSIATSIQGWKGDVHVSFGEELTKSFESAEEMAEEVDRQIWGMYRLHPSNLAAYRRLESNIPRDLLVDEQSLIEADVELQRRLDQLGEDEQVVLLNAYANSVRSLLKMRASASI